MKRRSLTLASRVVTTSYRNFPGTCDAWFLAVQAAWCVVSMQLQFKNERILAVVAHPDDAELLCAGTLARARDDGAAIGICVLCKGDKGQPEQRIDDLAQVRREEMAAAARLLDAQLLAESFADGELYDNPQTRRALIEVYRQFQPTLVLAHSSNDYHVDHRAAGVIAEAATWFCASPGHQTGSPPLQSSPSLWWMDTVNMLHFTPDIFIDIGPYVDLKRGMLACHKSQLIRGGDENCSPLESQMLRQCEARGMQAGVAAAEAFCPHHAWKRTRAW